MKFGFTASFSKNSVRFGILGFLLGLSFPIAGTVLVFRGIKDSIDIGAILHLHLSLPLLQIIDMAPAVLALAGLFLGLKTDQSLKILNDKKDERFKKLIENAAEVIYITDYKGNFTYFNNRIETVYGFNPQDLLGSHFTTLIEPSMIKKVAAFYLNQFEKKIPETLSDFQILDKQGNLRWVEQTVILNMKNDRIEGFQCIVRDIDNRIKQEQEILQLNERLNSKLDELENTNQELSAFNHTVSHDLRSPLRGISTLAEILQMEFESDLPEEAKGLLSRIVVNTTKIQTLVEDLLEFSKVGKKLINKEDVSMTELVDKIIFDLIPKDHEDKTSIRIESLSDCVCDKHMIEQVWINFISNALKYSAKKESPQIRIGNYFKNNEQVYFIKDNGAGFDMAYYHKLFGVFSRLHTEQEFVGTGVGLSIVKRIIERHGGTVWAEGEPGIGATFFFSLPVITTIEKSLPPKQNIPVFYS